MTKPPKTLLNPSRNFPEEDPVTLHTKGYKAECLARADLTCGNVWHMVLTLFLMLLQFIIRGIIGNQMESTCSPIHLKDLDSIPTKLTCLAGNLRKEVIGGLFLPIQL